MLFAAFGAWNLPFLQVICNISELEPSIFHATCSIYELEPSTLLASCNILELESSIWHAICQLLLVFGCCLLWVLVCFVSVHPG